MDRSYCIVNFHNLYFVDVPDLSFLEDSDNPFELLDDFYNDDIVESQYKEKVYLDNFSCQEFQAGMPSLKWLKRQTDYIVGLSKEKQLVINFYGHHKNADKVNYLIDTNNRSKTILGNAFVWYVDTLNSIIHNS